MTHNIDKSYICYFPTLTVLIDDNKEFLDSIVLNLDVNQQSYKSFSNARSAINFIKSNYLSSQWFQTYINILEEEKTDCKLVEFNIHDLHQQMYNKYRFNIITTVIADYDMPEINGLDLFLELKQLNLHKVILTGAADERLAVNAFNNKLIDGFISKGSNLVYKELFKSIKLGQNNYFDRISKNILESYSNDITHSIRNNKDYIALFNSIIKDNHIVEYYMIEEDAKYLLIDRMGQLSIFFIYPEDQLQSFYQLAEEDNCDSELLLQLKDYKKMVCIDKLHSPLLTVTS